MYMYVYYNIYTYLHKTIDPINTAYSFKLLVRLYFGVLFGV